MKKLLKYKFVNLFVYHNLLVFYNLIKYNLVYFKFLISYLNKRDYKIYDFKIKFPYKLDKYFVPNLNAHFSYLWLNNYEKSEKYLVEKYLNPKNSVIELGGCMGIISLIINRILESKNNHVVLEVDKYKFKFLERNKALNCAKFKILNGAVSNFKKLYYVKSNNFLGGYVTKNNIIGEKLNGYNFEDISKKFKINFDFLIMDIEGGEIEIFENQNLSNFKGIIFENHFLNKPKENSKLKQNLNEKGFSKIEQKGKVEYWKAN